MLTQISGYNVRWCGKHVRFEDQVDPVDTPLECAVCFETIGKVNCCTTECGHNFCLACLIKHSKGDPSVKCPLCRQMVTKSAGAPAPAPNPIQGNTDLARDLLAAFVNNTHRVGGVQVSRDLHTRAVEYTRRMETGWIYQNGVWSLDGEEQLRIESQARDMEWGF